MSQAAKLAGRPVWEPGAGAAAETCRAAIAPRVWEGNRVGAGRASCGQDL